MLTIKTKLWLLLATILWQWCPIGSTELDWWQKTVIYQIYPRSFQDSDGDGVGDLRGIIHRADYIRSVGVGCIWMSPIFKSPMVDFGYDITDYKAIDPLFGTMEDFQELLHVYHELGIKVLLDLVPNHTSDEHPWFQKSVAGIDPYTDYYVWVEAKKGANGTREPPSNWLSTFSGSAWTWNEKRGKYYLHQYQVKQPDLDYRNPKVLDEILDVIRFWLDKGVDGFRVDTAWTFVEDNRWLDEPRSNKSGVPLDDVDSLVHIYTQDQWGSYEVAFAFRALLDEYTRKTNSTKFLTTEAHTSIFFNNLWYGNATVPGSHFPFNFLFLSDVNQSSTAADWAHVINEYYDALPEGAWPNWVIGNHDTHRPATRFGRVFLDCLHFIQFLLPGTCITYNGDEFAMEDTYVRWSETLDPQAIGAGIDRFEEKSRDPERSPLQWNSSTSAGFSTNRTTWLPVNPEYYSFNEAAQSGQTKSHLSVYKSLIPLKLLPVVQEGVLQVWAHGEVLVITRAGREQVEFLTLANIGDFETTVDLYALLPAAKWRVYASSLNCEHLEGDVIYDGALRLRPKAGAVLTNESATGAGGYLRG
nr:PREDICTED: maltase A3-like [Bemisia tabaci]